MPFSIQCPNPQCGKTSTVADTVTGRNVRCKRCGTPFVARPTLDGSAGDTRKSRPLGPPADPFPVLPAQFGRYRVVRLLGRGGMGSVYLAEDADLGRKVALKLPAFGPNEPPQRVERFLREARSAAALHHPHICTVYDVGRHDGRPFLTMAFVDGPDLASLVDPDRPLAQTRAAGLARAIAAALAHAHAQGVVHRDLKPANVLLTPAGDPVVMDFGLAKRVGDADPNEAKLTQDGAVLGTPGYMAPEQVRGETDRIGPHTDVYALGVLLFELLAGRPPYRGPLGVVMGQILAAPVPAVREFRPDADPRLEAVCRTAMAKEPGDRFASMGAVVAALDEFLSAAPTAVRTVTVPVLEPEPVFDAVPVTPGPPALPRRRRPKPRRSPGGWWLPAAAAVFAAAAAVAVTLLVVRPKGEPKAAAGPDATGKGDRPKTAATTAPAAADGWVKLFNGRDLSGWSVPDGRPNPWAVENGAIVARRQAGSAGCLFCDATFADAHVRAECRVTGQGGGLYVRAAPATDTNIPDGYEAQINTASPAGGPPTGSVMTGHTTHARAADGLVRDGEWFTLELIAVGGRVTVMVNGTRAADWTDPDRRFARGGVALQPGAPDSVIEFRSVEVRDLSAAAPSAPPATAAGGTPLFDGRTLAGWRKTDPTIENWVARDGELASNGSYGYLISERRYRQFRLRAECRLSDEGYGGVHFWAPFDDSTPGGGFEAEFKQLPSGRELGGLLRSSSAVPLVTPSRAVSVRPNDWFRLEILATAARVTVSVNGTAVAEHADPQMPATGGRLALNNKDGQRQFRLRAIELTEIGGP